jgi:hypothetical protein
MREEAVSFETMAVHIHVVHLGEAARQGKSEKGGGEGVVDSIQHE